MPLETERIVSLNNITDTAEEMATIINQLTPIEVECKKNTAAHSFLRQSEGTSVEIKKCVSQ